MKTLFPKTCSCGHVIRNVTHWETLYLVGTFNDSVENLEMRNCEACGSCLAISVMDETKPRIVVLSRIDADRWNASDANAAIFRRALREEIQASGKAAFVSICAPSGAVLEVVSVPGKVGVS